ncbi:MAG: hypothetical protein WAX13_01390, partial [Gemmiger qucibialis]
TPAIGRPKSANILQKSAFCPLIHEKFFAFHGHMVYNMAKLFRLRLFGRSGTRWMGRITLPALKIRRTTHG